MIRNNDEEIMCFFVIFSFRQKSNWTPAFYNGRAECGEVSHPGHSSKRPGGFQQEASHHASWWKPQPNWHILCKLIPVIAWGGLNIGNHCINNFLDTCTFKEYLHSSLH